MGRQTETKAGKLGGCKLANLREAGEGVGKGVMQGRREWLYQK